MVRPVTNTEVLLQQISDSLVEITGLLRQPPAAADEGPVVVTEPEVKPSATKKAAAKRPNPKTKE